MFERNYYVAWDHNDPVMAGDDYAEFLPKVEAAVKETQRPFTIVEYAPGADPLGKTIITVEK